MMQGVVRPRAKVRLQQAIRRFLFSGREDMSLEEEAKRAQVYSFPRFCLRVDQAIHASEFQFRWQEATNHQEYFHFSFVMLRMASPSVATTRSPMNPPAPQPHH